MNIDGLSDVELALRPHRVKGPVMAAFLDAAAIQPAAAMSYRPATREADAEFERLISTEVLKPAAGGHWFDLRRHYTLRRAVEMRGMVVAVGVALTIAAIALLFYRG